MNTQLNKDRDRAIVLNNLDQAAAYLATAVEMMEACLRFPPDLLGEGKPQIESLLRDTKPLWNRAVAARGQVQQGNSTER